MLYSSNKQDKIILPNIVPFNDFFYYSCFYTMLFTAVKSLNRNIYSYMVNLLAYYSLYCAEDRLGIYIDVKNIEELIPFSNKYGIITNCKVYTDNLKNDTIQAIKKHHLVIASVNCYYESLRNEFYMKKDWRHSLLVYGFDIDKQIFHIIEHDHIDNPFYSKKEISMDEFCKAYKGYIKVFQTPGEYTFFELSVGNEMADDNIYWREKFVANQINYLPILKSGLLQILDLKDLFYERVLIATNSSIQKYIEDMMNGCNNVINFKKGQVFLIKYLYDANHEIMFKLHEIIELWTSIRIKLAKYLYSVRSNNKLFEVLDNLQGIYDLEMELLQYIVKE